MSRPFKLETLNDGGVMEAIEHGLQQIMDNIADPNTEAKKVRKLVVEVKFKPNEHRNLADVECKVDARTVPQAPQVVSILIDKDRSGKAVAAELHTGENPGQERLPGVDSEKVKNISSARKEAAHA